MISVLKSDLPLPIPDVNQSELYLSLEYSDSKLPEKPKMEDLGFDKLLQTEISKLNKE